MSSGKVSTQPATAGEVTPERGPHRCAPPLQGMGAGVSNLQGWVEGEFGKLGGGRGHLVLDEVLQLKVPSGMGVDVAHLGVLWVLDGDRDGRFSLGELRRFIELAGQRFKHYLPHEFESSMRGFCMLQLWESVRGEAGKAAFCEWFCKLLCENAPVQHFDQVPGVAFIGRDTVQTVHALLQVQMMHDVGFQEFLDLLQRTGEEKSILDIDEEELDDVVPLEIMRLFAEEVISSYSAMFTTLGFGDDAAKAPGGAAGHRRPP